MEWKWFIGGMVLVAVVSAFFFVNHGNTAQPTPSREVAAVVNGKNIYADDVSKEISRMAVIGATVSGTDALNVLVSRSALVDEANKQGVIVKGNETQQAFNDYLAGNNITRQQFEKMLAQKNLTVDYFISVLNAELTVKKLVEAQVPNQFIVKYNDVLQLYNSRYNGTNVTFDQVEKNLTDELTKIKQQEYKQNYMKEILSKAEVFTFG